MMDERVARLESIQQWHSERLTDHEDRIRVMEKANTKLAAYVGVFATLGSLFAQVIIRFMF